MFNTLVHARVACPVTSECDPLPEVLVAILSKPSYYFPNRSHLPASNLPARNSGRPAAMIFFFAAAIS